MTNTYVNASTFQYLQYMHNRNNGKVQWDNPETGRRHSYYKNHKHLIKTGSYYEHDGQRIPKWQEREWD